GSVVNLAARLCASAADREILMDAKVAEAIKDRRPLKGLGNRPLKGYHEAMPVFGISFDAPSRT
ncbi:MAG: adenylate/guanylate cyclase domain-containing protein, partial [Bradyrhizobium sp.]